MKTIRCLLCACALLLALIHVDVRPIVAQPQENQAQLVGYPEPNISTWAALGNDVVQLHQNPDGTLALSVNTEATTYPQQDVQQSVVSGGDGDSVISTDSSVGGSSAATDNSGNDAAAGDNPNYTVLGGGANVVDVRGGDKATSGGNVVEPNPPDVGLPYVETEDSSSNPMSDLGSPEWQREHMLIQLAAQDNSYIWFWGTEGNDLILIHQNHM